MGVSVELCLIHLVYIMSNDSVYLLIAFIPVNLFPDVGFRFLAMRSSHPICNEVLPDCVLDFLS